MTRGWALTNLIIQVLLIVVALAARLAGQEEAPEPPLPGDAHHHRGSDHPHRGSHGSVVGRLRRGLERLVLVHAEIIIHHTLGVIVILLFIFFNLVLTGVVTLRPRLRPFMWTALGLWLVSLEWACTCTGTFGDDRAVKARSRDYPCFSQPSLYACNASVGILSDVQSAFVYSSVRRCIRTNALCAICDCGGVNEHGKVVRR